MMFPALSLVFLLNGIFAVRDKVDSELIQKHSVNILQIFIMVLIGFWHLYLEQRRDAVKRLYVEIPVHQFGKVLYLYPVWQLIVFVWFGFYLQSCLSHSFPLWFICFVSPLPLLLLNCDLWEFETSLDSTDSADSTFISCHYWSLALSFSPFLPPPTFFHTPLHKK